MAQQTVNPYGSVDVEVPATESIAISTNGGDYVSIYYFVETTNYPGAWQLQQTINNEGVTLGAFADGKKVRIVTKSSPALYNIGTAPTVGVGDASTLGGIASSQFLRSDTADDANALVTFIAGLILNNDIAVSAKESGGTVRVILEIDSSNVVQLGSANNTANIKSNGTVNIPAADVVIDNAEFYRAKQSGGTVTKLIGIDGTDDVEVGTAGLPMDIQTNGTLRYNGAALASGTIDTTATQTITVVDGLITSIV